MKFIFKVFDVLMEKLLTTPPSGNTYLAKLILEIIRIR
jgi:hypothetical protein